MQVTFGGTDLSSIVKQMIGFLAEVHGTTVPVQPPAAAGASAPPSAPAAGKDHPAATDSATETTTLEQVRTAFTALVQAGKSERGKAILAEFGVQRLSDLKPAQHADALKKAQEV